MKKFNLNPGKDSIPSELVDIVKENVNESPSKLWLEGAKVQLILVPNWYSCAALRIIISNQKTIREHCALSNASESGPADFVIAGSLQPSAIEWCSISKHSHPADSRVCLLQPIGSSPAKRKQNVCNIEGF